jgi:hypothetical protein
MSTGQIVDPGGRAMLRWYPARWRARYGDELIAMIEEDLEGTRPSLPYRWALARSGMGERLREVGLTGDSVPPGDRIRGGALAVLCAFAVFVLPGVAFAKISEHWDQSIHRGSRHLPAVSFNLIGALAVACGLVVIVAAVALLPNFVQFLRTGGWPAIRPRVRWAALVTSATAVVGAGLVVWAHQLTDHQRNAGFGWYQFLFAVVAILFAATIVSWAAAAVSATRRLTIGLAKLKMIGVLAVAVAACMPVMTAAAAAWWGTMATTAPWFLAGTPVGSSPSPLAANLLSVLIVMTIASAAGIFGLLRVLRSWRVLQSAPG